MLTGGEEETGGAHIGREKGSDGPQFPFPRSFGIPFQSTYFVAYILLDICMQLDTIFLNLYYVGQFQPVHGIGIHSRR